MNFHIKADCFIEASSIDDAFGQLCDYFADMSNGDETETIFTSGTFAIEPSDTL